MNRVTVALFRRQEKVVIAVAGFVGLLLVGCRAAEAGTSTVPATLGARVLGYSSFLGGIGEESGARVAFAPDGAVYVAGTTGSPDFPLASPLQPAKAGEREIFITKFDPTGTRLLYSTFLGGGDWDELFGLAVDASGAAYVVGQTRSADFPLQSPVRAVFAGVSEGFVAKLSPDGSRLEYSTFVGGSGYDRVGAIAVDRAGQAYVTGGTSSRDFPLHNATTSTPWPDDTFVTKLSADGSSILFSTFLGTVWNDYGTSIAVDSAETVYLAGATNNGVMPVKNAVQPVPGGGQDAWVGSLNTRTGELLYLTYLGGSGLEFASALAVDTSGQAIVVGFTSSTDFPVARAIQDHHSGGVADAFVTRIAAGGGSYVFSTYLGGGRSDAALGVALDTNGAAHVGGETTSLDWPSKDAFQPSLGGDRDAFVAALDPTGQDLLYSTYLGGSGFDQHTSKVAGVALGPCDEIVVVGCTESTDFPVTAEAFQPALAGSGLPFPDVYLTAFADASITCPGDAQVECPGPFDPAVTGAPATRGFCVAPDCRWVDVATPTCGRAVDVARHWTCASGLTALSCEQSVRVEDRTPPALVVPPPLRLECTEPGGVAGRHPEVVAWAGSTIASDLCGGVTVNQTLPGFFASGCAPGLRTGVPFLATDECALTSTGIGDVWVVDSLPPAVHSISFDGACLWPPNHRFHCIDDVTAVVEAEDVCAPRTIGIRAVGCSSSQAADGNGDGNTETDCRIESEGRRVCLRAERDGSDRAGRTYTIVVAAEDECGNVATREARVTVPHDRRDVRECRSFGKPE